MPLALRIDDINASSKLYNQYSKKWNRIPIGNIGFLKSTNFFKAWGPYNELSTEEWEEIYKIIKKYEAKLTIAVTATWVTENKTLIPVSENIPGQIKILKKGIDEGIFEIANHGLTHCVLEGNNYLPKLLTGNRKYHREFWDWVPDETHQNNIKESQEILKSTFDLQPKLFVPPGNVFSDKTLIYAKKYGLTMLNCHLRESKMLNIPALNNDNVFDFHDREISIYGVNWLEKTIKSLSKNNNFCFVTELFD